MMTMSPSYCERQRKIHLSLWVSTLCALHHEKKKVMLYVEPYCSHFSVKTHDYTLALPNCVVVCKLIFLFAF